MWTYVCWGAVKPELALTSTSVLGASVIAQRAAQAGLSVKTEWMKKVRSIDRSNKAMIQEAAAAIEGLALPIMPSHGNFLVLETIAAGIRPEALVECYRRQGIMIRQGTYHTQSFGDRCWDDTLFLQSREALTEALGDGPSFVGNAMARDVHTRLHGEQ